MDVAEMSLDDCPVELHRTRYTKKVQSRLPTDNECDGIPGVVERALGTRHIHRNSDQVVCNSIGSSSDGVVRGLQGYLLPSYLSLRLGGDGGHGSSANKLPVELQRAHDEEVRHRPVRKSMASDRNSGRRDGALTSVRSRKRKRGRVNTRVAGEDGPLLPDGINKLCEAKTAKRRKQRRRKKLNNSRETKKEVEATDTSLSDGDVFNYQMMARVIVAPYTPSLISVMNTLHQGQRINEQSVNVLDEKMMNIKSNEATASSVPAKATDETKSTSTHPKNAYTKSSNVKNPNDINSPKLSSPGESLETIVDGVVCTLVRRTHRARHHSSTTFGKGKKTGIKTETDCRNVSYHRRQRQQKKQSFEGNQNQICSTVASSKLKKVSVNDWLLKTNLLSTGYTLGSCDKLSFSTSISLNNCNNKQDNPFLRGCPNMAPGIHCIQPNSLTTYARSSELMRLLHSVIGDDMLRELLLNTVILVPAISSESTPSCRFDQSNYFQLTGPPLNVLAKRFLKMDNPIATGDTSRDSDLSNKRKHQDECNERQSGSGNEISNQEEEWNPNKPIPRFKLFYCEFYTKHIGLSPRHLLNQTVDCKEVSKPSNDISPNVSVDVKLLDSMVQLLPRKSSRAMDATIQRGAASNNKRRGRWLRLRESGISMCRDMRRRHQNCDYARVLERHCPIMLNKSKLSYELDPKAVLAQLVSLHTPAENVLLFLKEVLRRAFPSSFWGSIHNFQQVTKKLREFINLGRTETFPEKAIVVGIRVLDMTWLQSPRAQKEQQLLKASSKRQRLSLSDHEAATSLTRNILRWVYCDFITPLLRSTFYITDTEFTGRRVVYYRKPVWGQIRSLSMKILLKRQYREMNAVKAQKILSSHNVGCPASPLRLMPKKTGIRAIAMLSKSSDFQGTTRRPTIMSPPNKVLQSTFHAIKYEYEKKPSLFGAGVLGVTEVFPSFYMFVEALQQRQSEMKSTKLYFTSVDIQHCYDTINQKQLFKRIRSVLEDDHYITQNHFILHSKDNHSSLRCRWKRSTCPPDQFTQFSSTSVAFSEQFSQSVFVDGVSYSVEKKESIIGLLRDHIFGQIVVANGNFGDRPALQRNGIPQVCRACVYVTRYNLFSTRTLLQSSGV
jgi:hypothetical protein